MARINLQQSGRLQPQDGKRYAQPSQETMYAIDKHVEEGEVEGDRVTVEFRGGHRCVFYETTNGA